MRPIPTATKSTPTSAPTNVPVRTTIGGAIVGLGAMVAALVFGASLGHLLGSPRLYGVTWVTEIWNNNGPPAVRTARPVVRADPDIATAAFIQTGIDFRLGGRVISGFAYEPVKGDELPGRLALPEGLSLSRLEDRAQLRREFDLLRRDLDASSLGESDGRLVVERVRGLVEGGGLGNSMIGASSLGALSARVRGELPNGDRRAGFVRAGWPNRGG